MGQEFGHKHPPIHYCALMRLLTTTLLFPDNPIFQVYLLAEHRRHQILPGLVRDGDIGFQGIVVFVTGEDHHHCFEITD